MDTDLRGGHNASRRLGGAIAAPVWSREWGGLTVTAIASAVMILLAGDSLDNWIVLSGQWAARDGVMTCLSGPASIRSTYESDEFVLRFEYRRAGKGRNLLAVHSKMTTGGPTVRLDPSRVLAADADPGQVATPPEDAWIPVTVEVIHGQVRAVSGPTSGPGPQSGSRAQPVILAVPPGSRGFLRFEATQPGLEIRNVRVEEPGFRRLFDDHSLAGWDIVRPGNPNNPGWSNEKGTVRCRGAGSGWLRTLESYDNCVLRIEYQLPIGGNSGIFVRAPLEGRVSRIGLEIQLLDDAAFRGRFRPAQFTGSVYDGITPQVQVPAPANRWNAIEVTLDGQHIRTVLNGIQLYDTSLDEVAGDVNHDKRPLSTRRLTGFIGLQEHSTPVRFRHVRLRELKGRM